jgi:ketosteroid isomerase-like protein
MSQENMDVVRAAYAAWNVPDMEAFREFYDPDTIVVRGLEGWPEPAPIVGRDAVMRLFEGLREPWEEDTLEPASLIDAGDRVVARHTWHAVGRGPDMDMDMTIVFTLRGGKIFLTEYFWDYREALEALELSEQYAHGAVGEPRRQS